MDNSFTNQYGSWAIICGASDGLGLELARECASKGLNCALIARRAELLNSIADQLKREYGVETRACPMDLMSDDATAQIEAIANDLPVGLFIINAGGDTVSTRFLESEMTAWRKFMQRNIDLLTESLHNFGTRFRKQGHGGIMVMGSDLAFSGAGRVSLYSASKAYAMNLIESLWTEWQGSNVDISYMVIGSTKTPKMLGILEHYGIDPTAIDLIEPEDLAKWAIANIDQGPTCVYDVDPTSMDPMTSPNARRERILRNTQIIDFFYGDLKADEDLLKNLKSGRNWK
ncbi:MAG: SDR family NAD(P)-dependent oxidoreductase [Acidimicrobiales bacterium]|nr:SDR family NAD(P)-dependent oxidoreductase [Hyphomonadaceae bacterium]RZV40988.1 MAG: SDR family NAD(P)-dependent oxidoreductase [Acidimicrobiales bacterium]